MSDLISRSALMLSLNDYALEVAPFRDMKSTWQYDAVRECMKTVEEQPAVEAKEVVRGEWKLKYGDEGVHYYCSQCKEEALFDIFNYQEKSNFCPHCGADMRKKA